MDKPEPSPVIEGDHLPLCRGKVTCTEAAFIRCRIFCDGVAKGEDLLRGLCDAGPRLGVVVFLAPRVLQFATACRQIDKCGSVEYPSNLWLMTRRGRLQQKSFVVELATAEKTRGSGRSFEETI